MTFTSLDFDITCGRYGLETEEHIPLRNINGMVWYGFLCYLGLVCRICSFCGLVGLGKSILEDLSIL
jgi:hypothetical protein